MHCTTGGVVPYRTVHVQYMFSALQCYNGAVDLRFDPLLKLSVVPLCSNTNIPNDHNTSCNKTEDKLKAYL